MAMFYRFTKVWEDIFGATGFLRSQDDGRLLFLDLKLWGKNNARAYTTQVQF